MNSNEIIEALDGEISRLQQVRELLTGVEKVARGPGRPKGLTGIAETVRAEMDAPSRKRTMSAAGRARIAAAQRARWAKQGAASDAKTADSKDSSSKEAGSKRVSAKVHASELKASGAAANRVAAAKKPAKAGSAKAVTKQASAKAKKSAPKKTAPKKTATPPAVGSVTGSAVTP